MSFSVFEAVEVRASGNCFQAESPPAGALIRHAHSQVPRSLDAMTTAKGARLLAHGKPRVCHSETTTAPAPGVSPSGSCRRRPPPCTACRPRKTYKHSPRSSTLVLALFHLNQREIAIPYVIRGVPGALHKPSFGLCGSVRPDQRYLHWPQPPPRTRKTPTPRSICCASQACIGRRGSSC